MLKEIYKKYISKYHRLLIIIGAIILFSSLGFSIVYYYSYKDVRVKSSNNDITISSIKEEPVKEVKNNYYYADIKGEVVNPNVYQIEEGMRIIDVIKMAGGLTDKADTTVLNLGKKISDEMVIIIYSKDDIKKFKETGQTKEEIIKYIEKDCKCPDPVVNEACINNEGDSTNSPKIALNTASKEALMTLTGIGDVKAQDIIDYRTANGVFKSIDDIKNVSGIGDSIFDKIKDYITL